MPIGNGLVPEQNQRQDPQESCWWVVLVHTVQYIQQSARSPSVSSVEASWEAKYSREIGIAWVCSKNRTKKELIKSVECCVCVKMCQCCSVSQSAVRKRARERERESVCVWLRNSGKRELSFKLHFGSEMPLLSQLTSFSLALSLSPFTSHPSSRQESSVSAVHQPSRLTTTSPSVGNGSKTQSIDRHPRLFSSRPRRPLLPFWHPARSASEKKLGRLPHLISTLASRAASFLLARLAHLSLNGLAR